MLWTISTFSLRPTGIYLHRSCSQPTTGRKSKPMAYENPINFRNNWWGTNNDDEIKARLAVGSGIEVSTNPFAAEEIQNAGPDWKEFAWMYI